MGMKLDLDRLKRELTPNEIINIIKTIEPDITYEEIPGAFIFPTVCHNLDISTAKKKLYYYFNEDDSPLFCCYTECNDTFDIYELVKKMIKDGYSFKFIQESTNISISHLSEINTGKRHFDNNEQYPLYNKTQNRKLSADQICEIYYLLSNTKESQTSIAKKFGVTQATISNINYGKRYKQFNQQYPIR